MRKKKIALGKMRIEELAWNAEKIQHRREVLNKKRQVRQQQRVKDEALMQECEQVGLRLAEEKQLAKMSDIDFNNIRKYMQNG